MLAGAVERKLMGSDRESFMGQFRRRNVLFGIDENIVHAAAMFANKVLMMFHERIETLQAAKGQYLKFAVGDELLQVPVDRSKTNVR